MLRLLSLWCWCGDFDDNVSWLSHDFSFEAFLWIGSVTDSSDESIGIDDRVTSLDDIALTSFFTVLVVGEFIVFNVKAESIIGWSL